MSEECDHDFDVTGQCYWCHKTGREIELEEENERLNDMIDRERKRSNRLYDDLRKKQTGTMMN